MQCYYIPFSNAELAIGTVDANEAITISLVTPTDNGLQMIESFHPKFTYAIFGEDERIFGYKGLKVALLYNANDMRPNLTVSCIRKFKTVGEVAAVDVAQVLKEFLPGVAFQKKQEFELALNQDRTRDPKDKQSFPPGELLKTIQRDGEVYEIWKGSLADNAVMQMVKRIQVCVLFYVEGGSYIGEDAEGNEEPEYSRARWSVFFLFKRQVIPGSAGEHQYIFQGYSTVYHFWLLEPSTPPASPGQEPALIKAKTNDAWELPAGDSPYKEFPHRARISQFVILPPFQGKGAGSMLYNAIFEVHSKNGATKEITVEDPNEAFDLLRDLCDMKYLRKNVPKFADLHLNPEVSVPEKGGVMHHDTQISLSNSTATPTEGIVDVAALEALRTKAKIAPRQFARLVEMHLMSKLPESVRPTADVEREKPAASKADKHLYTLWRLLLKQRLYRRNASILAEFEITERIIKLNETLENVEWEYARTLERLEAARPAAEEVIKNGKRKVDEENGLNAASSKKARVEDA
ncbi:histone acetyltransferase type B catalytic subunit [Pseudomassariella vexata]|uniref:Histone acetyltransferase type B catalytic subunit n=1 Tax=Pseudomassariella vexata TaxID=1141098 RepID=A0A1Y2EE76_9PEZI|nr:histone acetyltransferase type B catalytic subunit [Pseudomassariella vexata]ORY69883.1 histone acetyltransferase type B catalytic subunit [Pseudomassariella vexata]